MERHFPMRTFIMLILYGLTFFANVLFKPLGLNGYIPFFVMSGYIILSLILLSCTVLFRSRPLATFAEATSVLILHSFFLFLVFFNHYSFVSIFVLLIFTAIIMPLYTESTLLLLSLSVYALVNLTGLLLYHGTWQSMLSLGLISLFLYTSNYLNISRDEKLKKYATYDSLTNLPNRQAAIEFMETLEKDDQYGILLFDIDNFKIFNDVFGHKTGDKVLLKVVQEIKKFQRPGDFMARLSGDEFMLVIRSFHSAQEITHYAEFITTRFVMKYNNTYSITISSGLVIYPEHSAEPSRLIGYAALAMQKAKEFGKNNLYIYNKDTYVDHLQMYDTKKELSNALNHNDLSLHFQPIFHSDKTSDFHKGQHTILANEVLIRWNKDGVLIPASEFIPQCQEMSVLRTIDYYVLDQVCQLIASWLMSTKEFPPFSINISDKTFNDGLFIQEIKNRLYQYKIPSRYIIIEITESTLLTNHKYSQEVLNELGALGIQIMIDDFGTGYFSLNFLKSLYCDFLKIDPVFLTNLDSDRTNQEIIHSILSLGQTFDRKIIIEGIETETQCAYLKHLSFHGFQGYHFEKTMTLDELITKYLPVLQKEF